MAYYKIAAPDEYLAITGMGVKNVKVTKAAWVWPYQRCTRFSIEPHDYAMNLQAMTKEKLHFILPVVFTIGPDVNQQGRPDSAAPDRHDVAKSVDDRGDALMKYAMLLADSDSKDENHNAFLENIIRGIIEGETRVLVSNMTMEEIFTEGETFKRRIFRNIQGELDQLGLKVHKANVTQLKDSPDSVYFASSDRKAHHGATNKTNIGEGIPEPGKYGEDMAYHGDTSPCSDPRLSSGGLVELRQPVNREDAAMTYGQESTAKEMEVLYQGSPTTSWYLAILQVLTGEGTETRDMEKHTETSPDVDKYTALYKRRGGGGSGGGGGGGGGGRGARLSEHRHKPLSNAIRITAKQVKLCGLGVASWLVTGVAAQDPRPGARVGILQNVTTSGFGTVSWIAGLVGIQIGDMDVVPIATRISVRVTCTIFLLGFLFSYTYFFNNTAGGRRQFLGAVGGVTSVLWSFARREPTSPAEGSFLWLDQLNLFILFGATLYVLAAGASLSDLIAAVRGPTGNDAQGSTQSLQGFVQVPTQAAQHSTSQALPHGLAGPQRAYLSSA